jgi:hypothetical protein
MEDHTPEEVSARFEELAALEHAFEDAEEEISESHLPLHEEKDRAIARHDSQRVTVFVAHISSFSADATGAC